ncbi:conserved hypothetical protein [delta proteobacterium NaphS2]|nr:conserved hypothetical protein [delta proteobacterium NaphS2]
MNVRKINAIKHQKNKSIPIFRSNINAIVRNAFVGKRAFK